MQEFYVDTPEALQALCERLQGCCEIVLDTEFVREKTYYAQFCLLQLATDELIACVDPLALDDLSPLMEILYREDCTKVFHAGRQDLELFFDLYGKIPKSIFDTQIAAALLGYGNQVGYGALVQEVTGVELEKGHSRTDWSLRPLDPGQIEYALDDVRYLLQIYRHERAQLEALGRLDWLQDDFRALEDEQLYQLDPEQLWKKIRGANRLKPRQLAVLRELAAWREQQARQRNKPRKWMLGDEVMVDVARRSPTDLNQLGKIRGVSEGTLKHDGPQILQRVEQGLASPKEQWPTLPRHVVLNEMQQAQVDLLMAAARVRGVQANISVASLVTRKELEGLVTGEQDLAVLQGWRRGLVGEPLLALLQGEGRLQICEGEVLIS